MLKKITNNKILKILGNILYAISFIIIVLILLVVLIQRFSNNNFAIGGIRIFNVASGSMDPKYVVGDILIAKDVPPEEIEIGDTITYIGDTGDFAGRIVTHQVVEKKEENGKIVFITKGIANVLEDPEITEDQVYGKVIYKSIVLSFICKLLQNMYAFYFIIIVPLAIIVAKMIADHIIRKEDISKKKIKFSRLKEKFGKIKKTIKKIKLKHLVILICLLIFNTYAWFIYATEVSTSITAHVTSWNIEFVTGDDEIVTNIEIDLDRIYPGMDDYEKIVEVHNRGETKARLSYEFVSFQILGDTFEVGDNFTSEDLQNKIEQDYPFKINVQIDTDNIDESNGRGEFKITVSWPYESGDDELDTYWGNKAYEYYSLNPGQKSLLINMKLIATQA